MSDFDVFIIQFVNHFAQRWPAFDLLVAYVSDSTLLKGEALIVLLWGYWFARGADQERRREIIVATIAGALAALVIGRLLANHMPFRLRPVHDPTLGFRVPYGFDNAKARGWSAFPSDHAMLFAAIATGVFYLSRRAGAVVSLYVLLVILLPRLYVGLHRPTDLLGGALLGIGIGLLVNVERLRATLASLPLRWMQRSPGWFYACAIFFTFQLATLFEDLRWAAELLLNALHKHRLLSVFVLLVLLVVVAVAVALLCAWRYFRHEDRPESEAGVTLVSAADDRNPGPT